MSLPVAIVTGASRGIGRATAEELSRRGYRLALAARSRDDLEVVRSSLKTDSISSPTDITDPAQVDRLVEQTLAQFGQVDAVVNNAGVAPVLSIEQMTVQQWHEVINTNLSSTFYLCKAAWAALKRQGGVIVNLSSISSRDPFAGFSAYAAAKAGINLLSLALAREGEPHGIRVHTVAPGAVETGMFRALMSHEKWSADKTLPPEEVARVIAGCITGELRHTSGEVIFLSRTLS